MLSSVSVAACCCLGWCRLGMNFEADCDVKTTYSLSYLLIGLKVAALSCPDWRSKDFALWTESNGVTLYDVVRAACGRTIYRQSGNWRNNLVWTKCAAPLCPCWTRQDDVVSLEVAAKYGPSRRCKEWRCQHGIVLFETGSTWLVWSEL